MTTPVRARGSLDLGDRGARDELEYFGASEDFTRNPLEAALEAAYAVDVPERDGFREALEAIKRLRRRLHRRRAADALVAARGVQHDQGRAPCALTRALPPRRFGLPPRRCRRRRAGGANTPSPGSPAHKCDAVEFKDEAGFVVASFCGICSSRMGW